uniref:protein phosphatase 1 regulatory subunit SDS22 homolog n=1 Tax=Ciona intestinalis TaxID=7719 RepID=UPI00052157E6|nr:protein phosphatase 1 regulatory subunit SDS22 homolog [Ciona intestinalis]|eukprot:XP_009862508.1 protein phosphatase 1 regulatory subunit SDS22 homolog [Ciona intestinalis]
MAEEAAAVASRCQEAQETGVLNLSACGLMEVPTTALYLFLKDVEVTKIDLSDNQLKRIPPKLLSTFPKVQTLIVKNNLLTSLPKQLVDLQCLTKIDISMNKLTAIPTLPSSSVYVDLSKNEITEIGEEEIEIISNSKEFILVGNQLDNPSKTKIEHQNHVRV